MKKWIALGLGLLMLAQALVGCSNTPPADADPSPTPEAEKRVYALVVKDKSNPYMSYMIEGFQSACKEMGVEAIFAGSNNADAEEQIQQVDLLVERGVDAIAIAVNEMRIVSNALQRAMEAGIKVISVDSCANPDDRMLHVQQALPETIGRVLIQAAYEMVGGSGHFAILSTTRGMPNQALWVEWMMRELEQHPDKYADFVLVDTVYGLDEYEASAEATKKLIQEHPDLDLVIAPTTMGIKAAADVIEDAHSEVRVTGLGLPGDMAPYIRSGVCPWMYLWNPIDVGYIAAYAADALATGASVGAVGETVNAGALGQKVIVESSDGGTEIVVGNPFQFDSGNIAIWEELF